MRGNLLSSVLYGLLEIQKPNKLVFVRGVLAETLHISEEIACTNDFYF